MAQLTLLAAALQEREYEGTGNRATKGKLPEKSWKALKAKLIAAQGKKDDGRTT